MTNIDREKQNKCITDNDWKRKKFMSVKEKKAESDHEWIHIANCRQIMQFFFHFLTVITYAGLCGNFLTDFSVTLDVNKYLNILMKKTSRKSHLRIMFFLVRENLLWKFLFFYNLILIEKANASQIESNNLTGIDLINKVALSSILSMTPHFL